VNEYITPEEAAEEIRVSPSTIKTWLRSNELKGIKYGKLWRIRVEDWKEFKENSFRTKAAIVEDVKQNNESLIKAVENHWKTKVVTCQESKNQSKSQNPSLFLELQNGKKLVVVNGQFYEVKEQISEEEARRLLSEEESD
jgi:excisionase family DNA binding protein